MASHPLVVQVRKKGNPIIAGNTVTFIWQGKTAPRLVDDLHNWDEDPQTMQLAGNGVWSYSQPLAVDAYVEYGFVDPKTGTRLPDPLNPNQIWNGVNSFNHYFYMPGSGPSSLIQPVKGIARGKVTRHHVPTSDYLVGSNRIVYLYQPPVKMPVPLLVVYDGIDYLKRVSLNVMVDNLIATKRIRPIAMAMLQNGRQARNLEYSCADSTLGFLSECLLPLAQDHLALTDPKKDPYGVLGASMGGLMALYTGMRLPHIFGKVLAQSGPFLLPDHPSVIVDLVRYLPAPKIDIWVDAGKYEWLLRGNRKMYSLLKEMKFKVTYHEFSGGHNYTAWCNDLPLGLEALFQR
jgi:enterochelin esterase-like enzyme